MKMFHFSSTVPFVSLVMALFMFMSLLPIQWSDNTVNAGVTSNKTTITKKAFYYKVIKKIHSSLPKFSFAIYGTSLQEQGYDPNYFYKTIKITKSGSSKVLQTIALNQPEEEYGGWYNMKMIEFEDMNFDGYIDFRVPEEMYTKSVGYRHFLYNIKQKKYIENKQMNELLPSADFLRETKEIHVSMNDSANSRFSSTYKFINGKLVEVGRVYIELPVENDTGWEEEKFSEWKLVNSKLTLVSVEETRWSKTETCTKKWQYISGKLKLTKNKCVKNVQTIN
jgi:hypothetical protein